MLKQIVAAIIFLASPLVHAAGEISEFDIATYALIGKDGNRTDMLVRVTEINGNLELEGKYGNTSWKSISCETGCRYRKSSRLEGERYLASFPATMQNRFDIACIQNIANAFCRLTLKTAPSKGGYAFIPLTTGNPSPMTLQRLPGR